MREIGNLKRVERIWKIAARFRQVPFAVYVSDDMGQYSSGDCIECNRRESANYDRGVGGCAEGRAECLHGPLWRMSVHELITPGAMEPEQDWWMERRQEF
ncbi:MAG: hypothetical protein E5X48_31960 [Mesorhizobium sp.]|uniref:hypothetical protein n=1 Tax=Mesorhizobium sp. TaxID=1871066 RepID=UPI00122510CE|nr:hypothetical protein [Mesorhizobium sp.]TIQ28067.1 MAG: hypothetical protein E5X48_31960 [Mesorhizobium sp.]